VSKFNFSKPKTIGMIKKLFFPAIFLLFSFQLMAQSVQLTKSGGWLETAFVEWKPVSGAESYNVYYSGAGITNKRIDNQLIRKYDTYYRADALGLKAGTYTLKISPVISGVEQSGTTTTSLTILEHDRAGFAFSNGKVPGAYKKDGTLKDGAVILYISENTKNTISLDVTGATSNPCIGLQAILDGYKKGKETRPLAIRLIGQVTDLNNMQSGDIVIENSNNVNSHITLEGVGEDAVADGWGIRIKNASNIEIRNIGTMNCNSSEGDNIGLQQNNEYIWVHNVDFFYGDAGSDSDQAKGDGSLDCKKSTYVTFSYNHFWDSGKCNLLGLSEGTTDGLFITFHHNWYDHSDSRHPRVRFYSAHVYNNYYDGNAKYGIGSTLGSSVFAESNYFRNCKYPMLTSMQGSDVYNESKGINDYKEMPTFSKENGGTIKAFNNYIEGEKRFVAYGNNAFPQPTVDFDAVVVSSRNQTVANSIKSAYGNNTYNNFDVDSKIMYPYTADSPSDAKNKVMQYAGRMYGGDFKFTFNNAIDDASYAVNTSLKSALTSYKSKLLAIQGEGSLPIDNEDNGNGDNGGDGGDGGDGGEIVAGDEVHNFTKSNLSSSFYQFIGSLSTSKGSVNYGNLALTQCLKIESSTNISFTTKENGSITLVFNSDFSGSVYIDGQKYNATNGILTVALTAGNHIITKGDTANLYYISYASELITSMTASEKFDIHLYPNPTINILHIDSRYGVEKIQVYNLSGELKKTAESQSIESIDLSDLKEGLYVLKITSQNITVVKSIIKK
jgi:pectate lyase